MKKITWTPDEQAALKVYDADLYRKYPPVRFENRHTRARDVMQALSVTPNSFALWSQVRNLARGLKSPNDLTSVSITKALQSLSKEPGAAHRAARLLEGAA